MLHHPVHPCLPSLLYLQSHSVRQRIERLINRLIIIINNNTSTSFHHLLPKEGHQMHRRREITLIQNKYHCGDTPWTLLMSLTNKLFPRLVDEKDRPFLCLFILHNIPPSSEHNQVKPPLPLVPTQVHRLLNVIILPHQRYLHRLHHHPRLTLHNNNNNRNHRNHFPNL